MKNLSDIKEKIANFWDIEEDSERDALLEKIRHYAASKDEDEFIKDVRQTFEQINFSGISVIYEALSTTPQRWGQFFKEEYERAFASAEKSENPFEILECLEEISFVEGSKIDYNAEIINILSNYLTNPNDVLRYKSIWLIGDWITKENSKNYPQIVAELRNNLVDRNWKIRYITKGVLEDIGRLPTGYSINFLDKVRGKIYNPYKIK